MPLGLDISGDWAGIVALLLMGGATIKWLARVLFSRKDHYEDSLRQLQRDSLEELKSSVADLTRRLTKMERNYGVVVGVVHVIIDDLEPGNAALTTISSLLREAFPVPEDTPTDLMNLLARLDAKHKRKDRQRTVS